MPKKQGTKTNIVTTSDTSDQEAAGKQDQLILVT
jgi:hypothetical protein